MKRARFNSAELDRQLRGALSPAKAPVSLAPSVMRHLESRHANQFDFPDRSTSSRWRNKRIASIASRHVAATIAIVALLAFVLTSIEIGTVNNSRDANWLDTITLKLYSVFTIPPLEEQDLLEQTSWTEYHPDAEHPWNRLHRALYERVMDDGESLGAQALDPLLWHRSSHLRVAGSARARAIEAVDAFLSGDYPPVEDPLPRAIMQRDLWAAFDAITQGGEGNPTTDIELERGLAQAIKRVALGRDEILALPDNLTMAAQNSALAHSAAIVTVTESRQHPETAKAQPLTIPDLAVSPPSDWIVIGRGYIPGAHTHIEQAPAYARSIFLSLLRSPRGHEASKALLLEEGPDAGWEPGLEVALVRRALLIDQSGEITPSPLTESIQLRRFVKAGHGEGSSQLATEYRLDRKDLLSGGSGLRPVTLEDRGLPLFRSHGIDMVEFGATPRSSLVRCQACHVELGMGIKDRQSILTISRARFDLPDEATDHPRPSTIGHETRLTIAIKQSHPSWQRLKSLMQQEGSGSDSNRN